MAKVSRPTTANKTANWDAAHAAHASLHVQCTCKMYMYVCVYVQTYTYITQSTLNILFMARRPVHRANLLNLG